MLLALQMNMLLATPGAPPTWTQATTMSGIAVAADGTIGTLYLTDAEPVPGTATLYGGFALSAAGMLYVASWPGNGIVSYVRGIAVRPDGAMIIAPSGTTPGRAAGWALTDRGEVLAVTDAPQVINQGYGQRTGTDAVCMSEIS